MIVACVDLVSVLMEPAVYLLVLSFLPPLFSSVSVSLSFMHCAMSPSRSQAGSGDVEMARARTLPSRSLHSHRPRR